MKSKILLVMLIYAVSLVDAEVLGYDCDAKNKLAGHQIVGCEKIKTWSLERCPIFVQDQCNEKMPCRCKATIYVTSCQEKWRCIWDNATTSTTTQLTTSSSTEVTTSPKEESKTIVPYNGRDYTDLILSILGGVGAVFLIGLTIFLLVKNFDRIAIRNRSTTPSGFVNRLSILIENVEEGEQSEEEVNNEDVAK